MLETVSCVERGSECAASVQVEARKRRKICHVDLFLRKKDREGEVYRSMT